MLNWTTSQISADSFKDNEKKEYDQIHHETVPQCVLCLHSTLSDCIDFIFKTCITLDARQTRPRRMLYNFMYCFINSHDQKFSPLLNPILVLPHIFCHNLLVRALLNLIYYVVDGKIISSVIREISLTNNNNLYR